MQTILFFDLDATLVQNRFSRKVMKPLLREIATASDESIDKIAGEISAENKRREASDPDNVLTMDWNDILETVATRYGVVLSDSVDHRWQCIANADDVEVLDSAPVVLKLLKQPHRKLVLASRGLLKYQRTVLDVTGLTPFFDDILTPDVTGYLKTTPAFFERYQDVDAIKIQIGDHYDDDVISAKEKGFYSIMRAPIHDLEVYTAFERAPKLKDFRENIPFYPAEDPIVMPDAVVISLKELPGVIKQIEAQH